MNYRADLLFKSVLKIKMGRKKVLDIFLLICFFIFSVWLMYKSFGYNASTHEFRIARHQVGDFGLHISLIRSFSKGDNFPVQSPFYPGKPLAYHYYFDFASGMLENIGLPIDIAFNGLSILCFTVLLWLIYKLPQLIFKKGRVVGIISVLLFIFPSSLTFIDFFKNKVFDISLLKELWYLPDYIHKGPFDGSIISIFFTMNVFLNQRHLIAALAIGLGVLYILLQKIIRSKNISVSLVVLLGILLGLSSRFHTVIFLSDVLIIILLFILFKKIKLILPFLIPSLLLFIPHLLDILHQQSHEFIYLGFLSPRPFSIDGFLLFWIMNMGMSLILLPLGFLWSNNTQRKVFLSFLPLFIIGNVFQLSFYIKHNHSLFNYFFILANFYIAFALIVIWRKKLWGKVAATVCFFLLTISGFINIFVIKNDFQLMVKDNPGSSFMSWIVKSTEKRDIFVSRKEILDPITISGRKNYLGFVYDMGYDISEREIIVKDIYEARTKKIFDTARKEAVEYIVIPKKEIPDFNYVINWDFYRKTLKVVYEDEDIAVFQL